MAGIAAGKTADQLTVGSDGKSPDLSADVAAYEKQQQDYQNQQDSGNDEQVDPNQTESPSSDVNVSDPSSETDLEAPAKADLVASESIIVTDDKGRKQKITVDFNDREKLKKFVHMAYGMRKFQAERDALQKQMKSFGDPKVTSEKVKLFDELDQVFQSDGREGLINRISGSSTAYDELKEEIINEYETRRKASPDELMRMDAIKELQGKEKRLAQLEAKQAEIERKSVEDAEARDLNNLQTTANTVFSKHSFAGKLDDEITEAKWDNILWRNFRSELSDLEESGIELTPSVMNKVMNEAATFIKSSMDARSKTKLKEAVDKQKKAATQSVQTEIKGKMASSNVNEDKIMAAYKGGASDGLGEMLSQWSFANRKKK